MIYCTFWGYCDNEPVHAVRDLHQVGYRDYIEEDGDTLIKTVWAPCGTWMYGCNLHPLRKARMYRIGEQCPHGITGEERGVPTPCLPLVGKTAIVLETDGFS